MAGLEQHTAPPAHEPSSLLPAYDSAAPTSSTSLPVSCDESTSAGITDDAQAHSREDILSNGAVLLASPTNRPATPATSGAARRSSASSGCGGGGSSSGSSSSSTEYIGYQLEASRMRQQLKQLQTDLDNERETVSFLRSKVAQMNKDKVELASRHNEEVAELLEDSATMRAQLERHEDAQQRHEYELGRLQLRLSQAEQAAAQREVREALAAAGARADLERQQREADARHAAVTVEVQRLQDALAQKDAALEACCAERKAFESEKDELALAALEQTRTISELQQTVQQLQDERSQQQVNLGQCLNEAEQAREREKKLLEDLEAAERGIKMASDLVEEERVAHLESKLSAEILQKKLRDLEHALGAEMQAKSEAHVKIEQLHGQLRDMEEAYAGERKQNKAIRERLDKADRELASCQKQLQVEVTDKRSISSNLMKQLDVHEAEMDAIKAELAKAKKKQNVIEDAQMMVVRELEIMLETFELSRDSKVAKDNSSDSSASMGATAAVDGVRRLLGAYRSKLEAASDEVRKTRKLCESLAKEMALGKEELAAKDKALEDSRQQVSTSTAELSALRMSSSEMDARIAAFKVDVQSLSHELDKECTRNEELNNELTNAIAQMKSAEDEHVRYLHGLRQRFSAVLHAPTTTTTAQGAAAVGAGSSAGEATSASVPSGAAVVGAAGTSGGGSYDKYSWADVSVHVLDQAIAVLVELNSIREKVVNLESATVDREAFIDELQQEHSRLTDRLRAAMEVQASHFMRQKQETDEHHRRTVKEIQHHSKKTLKMADDAWGKVHRTAQVQHELERECADLRLRVSAITEHHGALHAAFAVLAGAYYPLLTRTRALAAQRTLLDDQLRHFEAFKAQSCQLMRALACADPVTAAAADGGSLADERQRGGGRASAARAGCLLLLLRFRVAAIVVMAANRLRRLRQHAGHILYFADGDNVRGALYVGELGTLDAAESSALVPGRQGYGLNNAYISDWLTNRGLLNTVVVCMEEVQEALRDSSSEVIDGMLHPGRLAAAVISSFKRLSDRLEACFPGLRTAAAHSAVPLRHRDRNSLHRLLNNGLHAILTRLSGVDTASTAQPAQLIFGSLQQRVLAFIQRLHAIELDRKQMRQALADAQLSCDERLSAYTERCRALQAEVDGLVQQREQSVTATAYDSLRRELDGALSRERQAQELLAEQSRQMSELGSKLSSDSSERLMSERALRASAQSVAGLQTTLQQKEDELRKASQQLSQTESERRALHTQLYEAERALQSAARDKEGMADYLRSVLVSLQQCGPSDAVVGRLLLPAERLSADVKERGPELVACQKLVAAFVEALHQANARATVLHEEVSLHKKHIGRLKDELSAVCRRESSNLSAGGASFGTRLPHEAPAFSSPYLEDLVSHHHHHHLPDGGSEASFSTSASRSESHRNHRRRSQEHRRDLLHNGNHRNAAGAFGASY